MTFFAIKNSENCIFIGVSNSNQVAPNISNHLHNKCKCTAGYFRKDESHTTIHLLARLESPIASQAWIATYSKIFQMQGFHVLNKIPKKYDPADAADLHAELAQETADALLARTRMDKAAALNHTAHRHRLKATSFVPRERLHSPAITGSPRAIHPPLFTFLPLSYNKTRGDPFTDHPGSIMSDCCLCLWPRCRS